MDQTRTSFPPSPFEKALNVGRSFIKWPSRPVKGDEDDGTTRAVPTGKTEEPNPSVSTIGLGDSPTKSDEIGFAPYVRAVSKFLCNPLTIPPLTMSIEGRWGSGKSSLLLQIAEELRVKESALDEGFWKRSARNLKEFWAPETHSESQRYTIWFNAWRSDKDEALWATFALTFMQQLAH